MRRISHSGYTIKVTATSDGGKWRPLVAISLARGSRIVKLQDEERFTTEAKAEDHGRALGKHWVNNRMQREKLRSIQDR
jgi:hypothetical protein